VDREALQKLREDIVERAAAGETRFGMIGDDPVGIELAEWFKRTLPACSLTWYSSVPVAVASGTSSPIEHLAKDRPSVIVVAEDSDKESAIMAALPHMTGLPHVLVAGYGHYEFDDPLFEATLTDLLVPSIANGYPNSLVHLYQCLGRAAQLELDGAVVEFGVFKGGTTMFLAKVCRALGQRWQVLGFDTFGGFPPKRSPLDMYDHPGAEFHDFDAVRGYLESAGVELVQGDIVDTASTLGERPVVLGFIDTDNYSSATAAVEALKDNVVVGGAIVFDHLTGVSRFRYTLGERMAASILHADERYFNLHATGVFLRQK
jgi:O-methyltransferase